MDTSNSIVFAALAEPTRLRIIDMLAERGELAAGDISSLFSATPSAISQHLKVLREAGLARVTQRGQRRLYSIDARTMVQAQDWLQQRTALWNARLDAMDRYIEQCNKEIMP